MFCRKHLISCIYHKRYLLLQPPHSLCETIFLISFLRSGGWCSHLSNSPSYSFASFGSRQATLTQSPSMQRTLQAKKSDHPMSRTDEKFIFHARTIFMTKDTPIFWQQLFLESTLLDREQKIGQSKVVEWVGGE